MKVSKVVLIVVALHVLVIGGIFIFEGCSRTRVQAPEMAANESQPAVSPDQAAPTDPSALPPGLTPATPDALATAPTAPLAPAPAAPAPAPTVTYAVVKGDSLWKIAKAQGTTTEELMRANNLTKTSTLRIGQKLTLPAKAETGSALAAAAAAPATEPSGANYTVKSGDSLWKIANQNGVTVASLKQANSLSSDKLKIGQKLAIPAKSATAAASATPVAAPPTVQAGMATSTYHQWEEPGMSFVENGQTIHVIDFDESLGMIAAKYGVSTKALMSANNITDARNIHPGQRLVIPSASGAAAPAASLAAPVVQTTASAK